MTVVAQLREDLAELRALGIVSNNRKLRSGPVPLYCDASSEASSTTAGSSTRTTPVSSAAISVTAKVAAWASRARACGTSACHLASDSDEEGLEAPTLNSSWGPTRGCDGSDDESGDGLLEQEAAEELNYVALDVVKHLPADKVVTLLANLRSQERRLQRALRQQRALCKENQRLRALHPVAPGGALEPIAEVSAPSTLVLQPEPRLRQCLELALRRLKVRSIADRETPATEADSSTTAGGEGGRLRRAAEERRYLQRCCEELSDDTAAVAACLAAQTAELQHRSDELQVVFDEIAMLREKRQQLPPSVHVRLKGRARRTSAPYGGSGHG